jgi:hypothetical protein
MLPFEKTEETVITFQQTPFGQIVAWVKDC